MAETSDRLNLINDLAIQQGEAYEMQITFPGDLSDYTLEGPIKTGFGGALLASFSFDAVAYNSGTDTSSFRAYLTAATTQTIPMTIGWSTYVYEIRAVLGGDVIKVLPPADVRVSPGV